MKTRRLLLTLAIASGIAAGQLAAQDRTEAPAWIVETLAGRLTGQVERVADGTLRLKGGEPVPLGEILSLRPETAPLPPPGRATSAFVTLTNGDLLCAFLHAAEEGRTTWRTPSLNDVQIPTTALRAVLFRERLSGLGEERDLLGRMRRAASERQAADRVWLASGDQPQGIIESFGLDGVRIERNGRRHTFPLDQVAAVRFLEIRVPAAIEGPVATLTIADGSILGGRLCAWSPEGILRLEHPGGFTLDVRASEVVEISFAGGRFTFLSDLEPSAADEKPFFRAEGTAPDAYPVWKFRRDAEVVDGAPLSLRGRAYARGLGVHAYSGLTYALDGRYARFVATVGVDDAAARLGNDRVGYGSVVFRIHVDGKVAYESAPLTGTSQPEEIRVDLAGARTLLLEVDFSDRADILDRADWAGAYLERTE